MLGRIRDAFATLLNPSTDERIERERAALAELRSEARALIGEMDDTLEKFSRVVARQAKRRNRDMQEAMRDQPPQQPQLVEQQPTMDDRMARKSAIWARVRARGGAAAPMPQVHQEIEE